MRRAADAAAPAAKRAAADAPVRAWVFRTNGDVSVLRGKTASTSKLIKQFEPILAATTKEKGPCYVEFVTLPRKAGGAWMLILDESGRYTQPQNVGFASFMLDMNHAGKYNGAIAVAHVSVEGDGTPDLDCVHPLEAPPVVADDDDDDDDALDKFFGALRRDWRAYIKNLR